MQKTREDMELTFWSSYAGKYDSFMNNVKSAYERIIQIVESEIDPNDYVLDVACGTGLLSQKIAPYVQKYYGCDISPEMVNISRSKALNSGLANVQFSVLDAYNLNYEDDFFDVVIISNALHVMVEPEKALAEIKRVLKSEGLLIAPTYMHGSSLASRAVSFFMSLYGFKAFHKWSMETFSEFIESNGFTILKNIPVKDKIPLLYISAVKND